MKLLFFFFSLAICLSAQTIKFEDRMNGDNSVAGLEARGWVVLDEDGGGTTPAWFQGDDGIIVTLEGTANGYVASNFAGANTSGIINHWLISPEISVNPGDSLFFYAASPTPGTTAFDDSISLLISLTAGITPGDFASLGRFLVPQGNWGKYFVSFNASATIRFAIQYYIFDGGPTGMRSNYIGLDLFQLYSYSSTYPSTIAINKSFTFSNITSSSSYRMISLPGNINSLASQFITGTRGTDWNAYYDNGAASNYLIEFDGSAAFNFKPGNGFWLLSKNAINVSTNVNTVTLAGDNTYSIPLHSGWNIISNPFERSTNWAAVIAANGLAANAVINSWNGSWAQPTSFVPYSGFYFNNTTGLTSLKIPYDPSGTLGKIIETNQIVFSENDLKLSLNAGEQEKSKVIIRTNTEANNDYDINDYFAPPGDFEEARIIIVNDKASSDYKYFMIDSRPEIGEGQIYNLQLKNVSAENVTLKIEGLNNYTGYEYYLIDNSLNNLVKVNEGYELNIITGIKEKNYSLVIGTESFIKKLKDDFTPKQFALMQNYPNPFNPSTKIRYTIPSTSISSLEGLAVKLLVYDILGNQVAELVNEQQSPGNYEVEFDARTTNQKALTSGVYFYTLRAGSFKETKKMILLR